MGNGMPQNIYGFTALGAAGVGKNTLAWKMMGRDPRGLYDTLWAHVQVDGRSIGVYVSSESNQYSEADLKEEMKPCGFFLCFNIADKSSFEKLDASVQSLLKLRGVSKLPFTVVGCKSDLQAERQVSDDEARQFAEKIGAQYVLTSSNNDTGVHEALAALVRAVDSA